jgi:hypothetical protein
MKKGRGREGRREKGGEGGREGRKELWPISDNAFAFGSKG